MMQVERVTNHDVKAIEYVLKERFKANAELHKVIPPPLLDLWCTVKGGHMVWKPVIAKIWELARFE